MTNELRRPIPLPDLNVELRRKRIIDYWNAIATCDDLGGNIGSLVRETEVKVTELLESGDVQDVLVADRITAAFEYVRQQNS